FLASSFFLPSSFLAGSCASPLGAINAAANPKLRIPNSSRPRREFWSNARAMLVLLASRPMNRSPSRSSSGSSVDISILSAVRRSHKHNPRSLIRVASMPCEGERASRVSLDIQTQLKDAWFPNPGGLVSMVQRRKPAMLDDPERVKRNIQEADTHDLLDRIT